MSEKVLIADGELVIASFLKKIVEYDKSTALEVDLATDGATFNSFIQNNEYAVILIDLSFPNINVIDLISSYSGSNPNTPIITMAATIDLNVAVTCLRNGAYDFVTKPFTAETMIMVLRNACEKRQLLLDKDRLNGDIQQINDELVRANSMITEQKEKIGKSLKEILVGIDDLKGFYEGMSQVKSVETTALTSFEKVYEMFKPEAMALLLYEEKTSNVIVKKEKNFSKEFSEGTKIAKNQFKHYFDKMKVEGGYSLRGIPENTTVTLPLGMGGLIIGLLILDLKSDDFKDIKELLFEIVRFVLTNTFVSAKFFEDSRRSYLESLIAFLIIEEKIHKGFKKQSEIVSSVSVKIAKALSIQEDELRNIQYAALLHLLGLTTIPSEEFTAVNYFNEEKLPDIKKALLSGADVLAPLVFLEGAQFMIKHIYENYDGSGIPEKLTGKAVPAGSRIIRVVGEYYAFKNIFKLTDGHIEGHFKDNSGKLYDPEIVKLLFNVIKNK